MHIFCEDLLRAFCNLFYLRLCFSNGQWKKCSVAKVSLRVSNKFLFEKNVIIFPTKLVTALLSYCLSKNKKQDLNFKKVGGMVTKSISAFCL